MKKILVLTLMILVGMYVMAADAGSGCETKELRRGQITLERIFTDIRCNKDSADG